MTDDTTDRPDPASAAAIVLREPGTVAEALDLHARLGALGAYIDDRKRAVRDWTQERAEQRKAEDGAAPTWRLPDGSVSLTDPQPTPTIVDPEAFARWYLTAIVETDPDLHDDAYDEFAFETPLGGFVRERTASVHDHALLDFLRSVADPSDDTDRAGAATVLADEIKVDVAWYLPEDAIEHALDPKRGGPVRDDGHSPRLLLAETAIVDIETGEEVPGTAVQPAGRATVQFRPTADTKDRLDGELRSLLGPPALNE